MPDGDWSNVIGSRRIQQGRAAIEGVWTIGLEGRDEPEDRAIHVQVDNIRQLRESHALVDVVMEFVPDGENPIREAFVEGEHVADRFGTSGAHPGPGCLA